MSYDEWRESAGNRPRFGPTGNRIEWDQWKRPAKVEIPMICSWCKKSLGTVEVDETALSDFVSASGPTRCKRPLVLDSNVEITTDGICDECDARVRKEAGLKPRGG